MSRSHTIPEWIDPSPWLETARSANADVAAALKQRRPGIHEFATLISPSADSYLEEMANRAQHLTRSRFGNTISLYAPLYLSDHCSAGCVYCGFSSELEKPRMRLSDTRLKEELQALSALGIDDVLLLTGDRHKEANFQYLLNAVKNATGTMHNVSVETFALTLKEYTALHEAGCTGVAFYQETYEPKRYLDAHRWGPKSDYSLRIQTPAVMLEAGIRQVGMGALLGIHDPAYDMLALFRHVSALKKTYWRSGISLSFPRIRPQLGDYNAEYPVDDRFFARIMLAFRICFPDMPINLSTRETAAFRDGMAPLVATRMSVESRTTVGGYAAEASSEGQFDISDTRDINSFCEALHKAGLEPVMKNWDAAYQGLTTP